MNTSNTSLQFKAILLAASALGPGLALPALAQDAERPSAGAQGAGNDIVVTAQRMAQRLQDVPISITVIDKGKIADNNIQSARDLATYTRLH